MWLSGGKPIKRFRALNSDELSMLAELRRRGRLQGHTLGGGLRVAYRHLGNFTVALLRGGNYLRTGVAKRNPTDADSDWVGEKLALVRAVQSSTKVQV